MKNCGAATFCLDRKAKPDKVRPMRKTRARDLTALVIIAGLFGGGGVAYGIPNLVVQLAALAILAINQEAMAGFVRTAPRTLMALVSISLALPLLQLVPLPPGMWHSLPGRDLVRESLVLAKSDGWFAASLNSARTFVAFVGLLAPLTVIVVGYGANRRAIDLATLAWIGLGLTCLVIGSIEIMQADGRSLFYPENGMTGVLYGVFANRNSTGIFLDCCLLLLCGMPAAKPMSVRWLTKSVSALLLVVGVVLTQSRTGMVLMALPFGLVMLRLITGLLQARQSPASHANSHKHTTTPRNLAIAVVAALVLLLGAIGTAALAPVVQDSRIGTTLARFSKTDDQRAEYWEDARYTAERYWWAGSGMGTFDEVFQADEALENVSPRRAGRAHNDYLEVAIEAGALGLGVIACWALWIVATGLGALRRPDPWPALSGLGILTAAALQSTLDYPLRNQAMLCMAAFAVVLLVSGGKEEPQKTRPAKGEPA